jgi:hypothetical protein
LISKRLEGRSHGGVVDIFSVTPVYQLTAEDDLAPGQTAENKWGGRERERTIRGDKEWLLMESGKKM